MPEVFWHPPWRTGLAPSLWRWTQVRFFYCKLLSRVKVGWRSGQILLQSCVRQEPALCWHGKLFFSCIGQPIVEQLVSNGTSSLFVRSCYGQLVRIHSKYYHRSEERRFVGILNRPHIKAGQFESDMRVWKVLIASPSRFHPTSCQCQNPAEFALQDVLLRWKPAVSCSSTGSRFRCFGSVASKSRGTHIFRRIRVA